MQSEQPQPQIYFCRKCSNETETLNPKCPQCGKNMQTQSQIKGLGKLTAILGILIMLGGGLGVLVSVVILLFAKNSDQDTAIAFTALAFCGAILAAGIAAIIGGTRQAKSGRTSKMFVWIFFGLIILMLVLGRVFSFLKN